MNERTPSTAAVLISTLLSTLSSLLFAAAAHGAVPPQALELRNRALAELENEQAVNAEPLLRQLIEAVPDDPLGHADLAVALLRQQKSEEALAAIDKALDLAPERPDLLAIRAEVLQWSGREAEALGVAREAAEKAPRELEILYGLLQLATTLPGEESEKARGWALERLAQLRPENVVVLSALGRRAIDAGDRETASRSYLRLEELAWQGPEAVKQTLDQVLSALEAGNVAAARVPALRLENVLKVTPMYQQSLRELTLGIQGVPVLRFAGEPPRTEFGEPLAVTFRSQRLTGGASPAGATLAVADLDGDEKPDTVRLVGVSGANGGGSPQARSPDASGSRRFAMQPAADSGSRAGISWARAVSRASMARSVFGASERAGESPGAVSVMGGVAVEVRLSGSAESKTLPAAPGAVGLLLADLDNDGHLDLVTYGPEGTAVERGGDGGAFAPATETFGLAAAQGTAAAVLDFDIEGDLDLVLFGGAAPELYRNTLEGPLAAVGALALPALSIGAARRLLASDLDRDGDLDLLLAHGDGLSWLDNLRQGRFADRTARSGLSRAGGARWAASADLDHDGRPDLVTVGADGALGFWQNRGGGFAPWRLPAALPDGFDPAVVLPFDADNDGRLDLALAGAGGVAVLGQVVGTGGLRFEALETAAADSSAPLGRAGALAAADVDGDGDLDLLAAGEGGLHVLANDGGNRNRWLSVRLRGLDTGNSKNNVFGLGSTVEVLAGAAYQFRQVDGDVTHLGLGSVRRPDVLRVTWTNGVPQSRLQPETDQRIVEEQILKGSCPFLYVWDGEATRFVTDLLWGAPLGLPVAPGVWASSDPSELVRVDGAAPRAGTYRLVITEELWEAAFFDLTRLWVVDHPAEVEVASNLRIVPGEVHPERVLGSRGLRPMAAAWDGRGHDVTARVAARDDVYAGGYEKSPYQGLALTPWSFTFDLGEAPAAPVRLHLDGWIFPTDASLNLAIAQRRDLAWTPPRLEVETAAGWRTLMPAMGFPAGKTKTMVVDTPPLPAEARRLRITSTLWLHWDRLAWTLAPADGAPRVVAKLDPAAAELGYRGFSRIVRRAPNAPHDFDFAQVATESPWQPFPGRYTRYGDVRELLAAADDRSVILGPGDAMELTFDAAALPPPPDGWRRTVFLESHGWDKDADKNTWEPEHLEPLPFRAMSGYPYGPGESFPDTPLHREYVEEWLTRVSPPRKSGGAAPPPGD